MEIDVLKRSRYGTTGSSARKVIQNNSIPNLDLIIRESVQNSMDAFIDEKIPVNMNFITGEFNIRRLAEEFKGISKALIKKFPVETSNFLAIGDSNTVGLTGDLYGDMEDPNVKHNLGKLVFNILIPQDQLHAGGSWGAGKTVYFRIGTGIVIYYSRILNQENKYEERLIASLVEDETKNNGLLSNYKNIGIAFFGEIDHTRSTDSSRAIIDQKYIHSFLDIFGIRPYSNNETGTIIIIPFVDYDKLLQSNRLEGGEKCWWETGIEHYIRLSLLRWYFPRFSDTHPSSKLCAFVNGNRVVFDNQSEIFRKFKELYDKRNHREKDSWFRVEDITKHNQKYGTFIYGVVKKEELGIIKYYLPNPYQYTLNDLSDSEDNTYALIGYTRKHGLIIDYEKFEGVKNPDNGYVIGLFVLSEGTINTDVFKNIDLDEYIRQSEHADHSAWEDHAVEGAESNLKPRIVSHIKTRIKSILRTNYAITAPVSGDASMDMSFASIFGKLLLPDENFGHAGSSKEQNGSKSSNRGGGKTRSQGGRTVKQKGKNVAKMLSVDYGNDFVTLKYEIDIESKVKSIRFINYVDTIGGSETAFDWENDGLKIPCSIEQLAFSMVHYDEKAYIQNAFLNSKNGKFADYDVQFESTESNKIVGFKMISNKVHKCSFVVAVKLKVYDKHIQTSFDVVFGE